MTMSAPTARLWRGLPQYIGEFWTEAGPVVPRSWSPNRIVLQVDPGQAVSVNQNPGSWWLVNGRRSFLIGVAPRPGREFVVQADARGRLELQIRPRGLELGLALHVAGFALVGLVYAGFLMRFSRAHPVAPRQTLPGLLEPIPGSADSVTTSAKFMDLAGLTAE